jgi:hypothetical protein
MSVLFEDEESNDRSSESGYDTVYLDYDRDIRFNQTLSEKNTPARDLVQRQRVKWEETQRSLGKGSENESRHISRSLASLFVRFSELNGRRGCKLGQAIADNTNLLCHVNFNLTCLRRKSLLKERVLLRLAVVI